MEEKYIVVLSLDAVSSEDLTIMKTLKNFSRIISEGAVIENVETIYPSLTYPAHATIVTGKYPCNHKIINNQVFKAGDNYPNWNWFSSKIKGDTLFNLIEKENMTSCSLFWPVTAGASEITYNMPEIFPTKPWHNQVIMSLANGSRRYQYDINSRFGHLRKGTSEPELDNFTLEAAKHTISEYTPNAIFVHFIDVDSQRHDYGYNSQEAYQALIRHDKRLGEIIDALEDRGILDKTNLVVLGDHSAINVNKLVRLNKIFVDVGLIIPDEMGRFKDYKAMAHSCDGSTYIYLKDSKDKSTKELVKRVLNEIQDYDENPIEFVLTSEEAKNLGADEKCLFMLEAKKGYYFVDETRGEFIEKVKKSDIGKIKNRYFGTHGYSPKKENYTTFFIAWGKDIKEGITLENGHLINHGPTIGKMLGLEFLECDGVVERSIFK